MRRAIFLHAIACLLMGAGMAQAQREGAQFGEGFVAKVTRLAQEHPAETVAVSAGSTAVGAAIAALIRELNKRKKEGDGGA